MLDNVELRQTDRHRCRVSVRGGFGHSQEHKSHVKARQDKTPHDKTTPDKTTQGVR